MEMTKEFAKSVARLAKASATAYYMGNVSNFDFFSQRIEMLCAFSQKLNSLNVTKGLPTLVNVLARCTNDEREKVTPIVEAAATLAQYGEMLGLMTTWIEDLDESLSKLG